MKLESAFTIAKMDILKALENIVIPLFAIYFENLYKMVKYWGQQTFSKLFQKSVENPKTINN